VVAIAEGEEAFIVTERLDRIERALSGGLSHDDGLFSR